MRLHAVVMALFLCGVSSSAQDLRSWPKLLDENHKEEARKLCEAAAKSSVVADEVEAEKCLANVALCGNSVVSLQKDDEGDGGSLSSSYTSEAADEALTHLNRGITLAPQDLSIHQGRLHILEATNRYDEMAKALDESASIYKGKDAPDVWIVYTAELFHLGRLRADIQLLKILDRHFPNNHEIIGNLGGVYSMLKDDANAVPYLRRAVALSPNDPVDNWNLARELDYSGDIAEADAQYQKALSMPIEDAPIDRQCLYAKFVTTKLKDRQRGCAMEIKNCAKGDLDGCGTK
jgi:tetratricopeptide (TPR) repeat protein